MNYFVKRKADIVFLLLIFILNIVFSFDYLWHGEKPANFDAVAHITTMAQFHSALTDGEFPVGWGDGFANYGLPLGTIAHQIPAYGGAFLTFLTNDVLLSFHIMYLIAAVLSSVFFYILLRRFVSPESSFLGSIFYTLAPYRIINFYMRGALPEFFSAVWVPLIMLAVFELYKNYKRVWPYVLLMVSTIGLILTHPMMLVVYVPILGVWFLVFMRKSPVYWVGIVAFVLLAFGITAYYFVPLNFETKYLYHGMTGNHYINSQTANLSTFVDPWWKFNCVYRNDIFGRCHLIKAGVTEMGIVIASTLASLYLLSGRKKSTIFAYSVGADSVIRKLWFFALVASWLSILMSTSLFEVLYSNVRVLGNIQYAWRFMSSFLFIPPIFLALIHEFYLSKIKFGQIITIVLIAYIVMTRFPQLYGKNYTYLPQSYYYFTPLNLHSFMMNTIWSGNTDEYPIKREKAEIIQGKGKIVSRVLKNASRSYEIQADEEALVSDNTFYFPGWKVYIDNVETLIEFQDPAQRGVITFKVPPGRHSVRVIYEDTKIRWAGKIITGVSLISGSLLIGFVSYVERRKKREA